MCVGISGSIGNLVVDNDHIPVTQGLPIDMFVNNITARKDVPSETASDSVDSDGSLGCESPNSSTEFYML